MENLAAICIVPEDLIVQVKSDDKIQGFDEEMQTQFSSIYTSNAAPLLGITDPKHVIIILYLSKDANDKYSRDAKKLIKKFGTKDFFLLVTGESQPDSKTLSTYFSALAKTCARVIA